MEEERKEQERLEQMELANPTLNIKYMRKMLKKWAFVSAPNGTADAYKGVLTALKNLIDAIEEFGISCEDYRSLFFKYIPDIIRIIENYHGVEEDGVDIGQLREMLEVLENYLSNEVNNAKIHKRMDTSSTVEAYTNLFGAKGGDGFGKETE